MHKGFILNSTSTCNLCVCLLVFGIQGYQSTSTCSFPGHSKGSHSKNQRGKRWWCWGGWSCFMHLKDVLYSLHRGGIWNVHGFTFKNNWLLLTTDDNNVHIHSQSFPLKRWDTGGWLVLTLTLTVWFSNGLSESYAKSRNCIYVVSLQNWRLIF